MLTDEELTTRLGAAFHDGVPELTYAGPMPQVRRGGAGLVATSGLAAAAAVIMVPTALQQGDVQVHRATPTSPVTRPPGHQVVRTLEIAGLHLSFSSTDEDLGQLYLVLGDRLQVPPDAEQVDLGLPVTVWFAHHPTGDDPQVYVGMRTCPDTTDGCGGNPPQLHVYGILAPGWTRDQLIQLLEHPVATQRGLN